MITLTATFPVEMDREGDVILWKKEEFLFPTSMLDFLDDAKGIVRDYITTTHPVADIKDFLIDIE
jgi:hypothetical protein